MSDRVYQNEPFDYAHMPMLPSEPMKIDVDATERLKALVKAHGTQKATAAHLGCTEGHVCDLLHSRRTFSDVMLSKLGLRRTIIAEKSR